VRCGLRSASLQHGPGDSMTPLQLQPTIGPSVSGSQEIGPPVIAAATDVSAGKEEKRIPELDGLRGIAILMVLLFHFSDIFGNVHGPFRGLRTIFIPGWTGVDLFFVLSGFLISGVLLNAKESRHYFKDFYIKRVLRIFPVYYAALALFLIGAKLWDSGFHISAL